ncbi:hypothetical protein [Nocardia amamiensis]|uniref:hypothetical protein n=1 Tax=Nocardia amamiensis TaxID=404578 RepID=UPI0012F4F2DB|nr:hypothetical protein [Nocardia amamiensis]
MLATNSWDGSLASTDDDRVHWYIGIYAGDEQISGHSGPNLEQLYLTATTQLATKP